MAFDANDDVNVLTKLVQKCNTEGHRKFGMLNQSELRAMDELIHTSDADSVSKTLFYGAALEYRSTMVAHGKFS